MYTGLRKHTFLIGLHCSYVPKSLLELMTSHYEFNYNQHFSKFLKLQVNIKLLSAQVSHIIL